MTNKKKKRNKYRSKFQQKMILIKRISHEMISATSKRYEELKIRLWRIITHT